MDWVQSRRPKLFTKDPRILKREVEMKPVDQHGGPKSKKTSEPFQKPHIKIITKPDPHYLNTDQRRLSLSCERGGEDVPQTEVPQMNSPRPSVDWGDMDNRVYNTTTAAVGGLEDDPMDPHPGRGGAESVPLTDERPNTIGFSRSVKRKFTWPLLLAALTFCTLVFVVIFAVAPKFRSHVLHTFENTTAGPLKLNSMAHQSEQLSITWPLVGALNSLHNHRYC